jgi:hypothetical protein
MFTDKTLLKMREVQPLAFSPEYSEIRMSPNNAQWGEALGRKHKPLEKNQKLHQELSSFLPSFH